MAMMTSISMLALRPSKEPPGLEEGELSEYANKEWFPAAPGKVLQSGYKLITKLGFGRSSTVWLCQARESEEYLAIKIPVARDRRPAKEVRILNWIKYVKTSHPGAKLIRTHLDECKVSSKDKAQNTSKEIKAQIARGIIGNNKYHCIVYEPLGPSLRSLRANGYQGRFTVAEFRPMLKQMLSALDFIHRECNVVHGDIHAGNFLMLLNDKEVLKDLHKGEIAAPTKPNEQDGFAVYQSRQLPISSASSVPILCAFGCSVHGKIQHDHHDRVCSDTTRPPELILRLPWTEKIDIWCLGLLIWSCIEGRQWYCYKHGSRRATEQDHMAWTFALLGSPSPASFKFIQQSKRWKEFFASNAQFRTPGLVPRLSMMSQELALKDDREERKAFFILLSRMLQWNPDSRASARDLLEDHYFD